QRTTLRSQEAKFSKNAARSGAALAPRSVRPIAARSGVFHTTATSRSGPTRRRSARATVPRFAIAPNLAKICAKQSRAMPLALDRSRVLLTGGSGFLGSFVAEALTRRGAREVVIPRSREHDLTDARATQALFERGRFDLVIHLAAKVGGIGAN